MLKVEKTEFLVCRCLRILEKIFTHQPQDHFIYDEDLETILDKQVSSGDVFGAIKTLKTLDRPLELNQRMALIQGCLWHKKFAKAYYLTRSLPANLEKKNLLALIAKKAAFGDDYSTARSAALLSEKISL